MADHVERSAILSQSWHRQPFCHPILHTLQARALGWHAQAGWHPWIMELPPNVTQVSDSDDDKVTPHKEVVRKHSPRSAWPLTPLSGDQVVVPGKAPPTVGCQGTSSMAADGTAQEDAPQGVPSAGARDLAQKAASKPAAANPKAVAGRVRLGTKGKPAVAAAQAEAAKAEAARGSGSSPAQAPLAPAQASRLAARPGCAAPAGKRSRGPNKDRPIIGLSS